MSVIKYRENVNAPWQELAVANVTMGKLPDEAMTIAGDCTHRFSYGGWDWYINQYGKNVTTKNITHGAHMFEYSTGIKEIPFELNFATPIYSYPSVCYMFANCSALTSVPKINNCSPEDVSYIFRNATGLREVPEDIADWFDWTHMEEMTSAYSGNTSNTFYSCYSLRHFPMSFLERRNPNISYSYSIYYYLFNYCFALDEIVDLPNPHQKSTWTSNAFSGFCADCYRIKNLIFRCPDGKPYEVKWKNQTIDLSSHIGYAIAGSEYQMTIHNSGITTDTLVTDDATYQALKNDPDWWTTKIEYSRYNHDSAVATINSLPDASAYLATTSGTNTIKFKGASGSATDGGAINTLTAEEIAVATAKGWTVTLV